MVPAAPFANSRCAVIFLAALAVSAACAVGADPNRPNAESDLARQILETAGLEGGLVVHLGCGHGRLTAALRAGESYVVQGLDTDADQVRQARAHIQELGIYGPVSAEPFDGKRLPYAEKVVNLVVAEDLGGVAKEEAMRVLAPGGVLLTRQDGRWTKAVKPRPQGIDEWTHFLHDASGNAVAHDEVVGPPRRLQWVADPRHTRSHEHIPSIYAVVSTGGRIFYIADFGPVASVQRPADWHLVARDAFNGILLWQQPIATWFPHIVNWGQTPRQLERKLVAVGDRVYVTLGLHSPLSAVDAATGEVLKIYENTAGTEEVLYHRGTLLLVVRSVTDERVAEIAKWARLVAAKDSPVYERDAAEPFVRELRRAESKGEKAIFALDADTGRGLWKKDGPDAAGLRTLSLCADGDRVFCQNGRDVVCLDLATGREKWSAPAPPLRLVSGDLAICADGKSVTALAAETGEARWSEPTLLTQVRDAFVARGSLWLGGFKPFPKKRGPSWGPYFATQRDLATGKVLRHIEPENPGHHHRCYQNKATDRYILGGRRGTEFIDLSSGEVLWNSWARGVCRYGVMPCNGLLYAPPHACGCYVAAKLTGFNALASEMRDEGREMRDERQEARLERGPAYGASADHQSSIIDQQSAWTTYRHDARRSGSTRSAVPAALRTRWQTEVGARLTSPTVGGGRVFVASVDQHRVVAVDADSGQPAWQFTAGARVDSPPTLHGGRAIFGCCDGRVYCVRASDGELAWRFRAARDERLIVARGQLESVWPVHGSVLIEDGVAYVTAGRSSYLDGGIDLCRLDPQSGKLLAKTQVYSPDPETGRQPPQSAPSAMPGTRSDILAADQDHVYLRDKVFGRDGRQQPEGNAHLFTLTDFLDDSWPHRSYWIFGTHCSLAGGCSGRDRNLIYGRLLVFDDSSIYGYGRTNVHWSNQLQDGPYRLFAVDRRPGKSRWQKPLPIQVRAMTLAGDVLFVAGPRAGTSVGPWDRREAESAVVLALSASDGAELGQCPLEDSPVFDGMAAANGRLYVALENGQLVCMDEKGT